MVIGQCQTQDRENQFNKGTETGHVAKSPKTLVDVSWPEAGGSPWLDHSGDHVDVS